MSDANAEPGAPRPVGPRERTARIALALALCAGTVVGWRAFEFLCDDAFIVFRYVSNHVRGFGFTWNPPPFQPVDGFTNFLWMVLLRVVWGVTGFDPPHAAPLLGLVFGLATLAFVWRLAFRMQLPARHERWRTPLVALALLGIVTNRTFLTWLSSGLGTPLFNLCLTAFVCIGLVPRARRGPRWALALSSASLALALTRPDGFLFAASGALLVAREALRADLDPAARRARRVAVGLGALPFAGLPVYLAWRVATYGEVLPNTYYAKAVKASPEVGLRYLGSFALEYGVYVWAALALAWLVLRLARPATRVRGAMRRIDSVFDTGLVVGSVLFHFGYYTFYIGGDHFEYRVYSHLVPLLFVSGAWLAARVLPRPGLATGALAAFVLASWPIPWTHWLGTRGVTTWREAENLTYAVAPRLPAVLSPMTRPFDRWQAWLIERYACMRHQEHVVYLEQVRRIYPTRAEGSRMRWVDGHPVLAVEGVGLPAWVLPEVAIIDLHGLNDRVIARRPIDASKGRRIAHDRTPPPGYVRAFRPNVELDLRGGARVVPRKQPLTDDEIRAAEARAWY